MQSICFAEWKYLQRVSHTEETIKRSQVAVLFVKRGVVWSAKILYMVVTLGIIAPILLALIVEAYLVLPLRLLFNADLVPRIRIVDMWALGLVYGKILLRNGVLERRNGPISKGVVRVCSNLSIVILNALTHKSIINRSSSSAG